MNDIVSKLRQWGGTFGAEAADEIERLREALSNKHDALFHVCCESEDLQEELGAKQAEIDRLMLEFCPEEMTAEQLEEWGNNQVAVEEKELALLKAQEPVAIFNGVVDCGEHGAFDLELLKMIPRGAKLYAAPVPSEVERSCTCHPDDNPPSPCQKQYALSECIAKAEVERDAALYEVAQKAATLAKERCKNATGQHHKIELYVSANQCAEDAVAAMKGGE